MIKMWAERAYQEEKIKYNMLTHILYNTHQKQIRTIKTNENFPFRAEAEAFILLQLLLLLLLFGPLLLLLLL